MPTRCKDLKDDGRTCAIGNSSTAEGNKCMYATGMISRKPWCFTFLTDITNSKDVIEVKK